jgi:hypothetical protein
MLPITGRDILKAAAVDHILNDGIDLHGESGWEKSLDRESMNADDTPERDGGPFLHSAMDYNNGDDYIRGETASPGRQQPYENDDYRSQSDAPPWFQMLGT